MASGTAVLDQFTASYADDQATPVSLTAVKLGTRPVVLQGALLNASGAQQEASVQTGRVTDWMIEYGATPGIWVVAENKWYKLLRPAAGYTATHHEVQRKLDLCARAAHILRQRPDLRLDVVVQLILQPSAGPMGSMSSYTVQELQQEAPFMLGQLAMLAKRLNITQNRDILPPLLADLSKMCVADAVAEVLLSLAVDDDEDKQDDDDEGGERSAKRQRVVDPRDAKDAQLDAKRPAAPRACTDWRLDPHLVPDLLTVWEFCLTFAQLLHLSPIQLHELEAAIAPGPLPLRTTPYPTPFAKPGERAPYNLSTLLDADGGASGIILRDIHHMLMKVIDGFSIKRLHEPPEQGKIAPDDNKMEAWQERVVNMLLDAKTPQEFLQPGVKNIAEIIKQREYFSLTPAQRLTVLRTLVDLALNSDVMRDYTAQKGDQLLAGKTKGDFDDSKELSEAELADPETWMQWAHSKAKKIPEDFGGSKNLALLYKYGVRRSIGADARGRRYWVFASKAACWRVFIEGPELGTWGWYEGAVIPRVTQWLRTIPIEREAPMIKALDTMPTPRKYTEDPVPSSPLPLNPPPADAGKPIVYWTPEDMKSRRPDGYKMLEAPLLKGEYHQQVPSGCKPLGVQERLVNVTENLLTEFDFFLFSKDQLAEMIKMILTMKDGKPQEQAKVALRLEALLHDANLTSTAWREELRDTWQRSLQRESPALTSKDVAMHLAALQYHIQFRPHRLTRLAFTRQVAAVRCPLLFPQKDDPVVFMRSGCLMHLDKYAGQANHFPVDDVVRVRQEVAKLRPVEHCKVVAIGYRSYPPGQSSGGAGASGGGAVGGGGGAHGPAPGTKAATGSANPNRPYCMWMVLQQVLQNGQPGPVDQEGHLTCVPIHLDASLPDYIVKPDVYMKGMMKMWAKGERFRMYFGGKSGSKTGGTWYKGTVVDFAQNQGQQGDAQYDPWDSIIVQWDADDGSSQTRVNPWEIEIDPDEAKAREAERRKAEEAAARARRAEEKSRRSALRMKAIEEDGIETDEESSESMSDDEEEDEDSDGRRRKYTKRKPVNNRENVSAQQQQQARMQAAQQVQHFQQLNAQHQQHHATLMQQLQHLQSVGQGNSPIAQQVIQALQQVQRAQQQLLLSMQQAQATAGGQQQRPGPQNQLHPHQQQMMQQARPQQGGMVPQNHQQAMMQQQMLMQQQAQQRQAQQQGQPHMIQMQQQQMMAQMTPQQQQLLMQQQQQQQLLRQQQQQQQGYR